MKSSVLNQLKDVGLLNETTLLGYKKDGKRITVDYQGNVIDNDTFNEVNGEYVLLSYGEYSKEYAKKHQAIKASNDDAAMMFGYKVDNVSRVKKGNAYIIDDYGFMVSGRFESELVASAILIEKMCKVEILGSKVGQVHHLNPVLCLLEHLIYLKSYSKKEKELSNERK